MRVGGRGGIGRRWGLKILCQRRAGSSPAVRTTCLAAALLGLAACNPRGDDQPVAVSAIGSAPKLTDPATGPLPLASRLLVDATAQGLVRFDAAGNVEPGLAERWTVIDDGMSYIFRLREAEWADGKPVEAAAVVRALRRQLAGTSRNELKPWLTAIDEIVEMTPQVIEVRLSRPRPDLLRLFAQPEMAVLATRPNEGTGPMRLVRTLPGGGVRLRPAFDPRRGDDPDVGDPGLEQEVELFGESAARAVLRFLNHRLDLATGGTFVDWPLLAQAQVPQNNLHRDPASGLFGLAVVRREGFLAEPGNRSAVAIAIDRSRLAQAFGTEWPGAETILPDSLDSAAPPAQPSWAALPMAERRARARAQVLAWVATQPADTPSLTLRVGLPTGPGGTLLWGIIASSLRDIAIVPERVAVNDPTADLLLVDAIAPYDNARWFLASACRPCSPEAQAALDAARLADTLRERSRQTAEADRLLAADTAFIPLARPLRWSLVALRLKAWTGNARAWHVLNRLRNEDQ